jgi:hypothetical protein
MSISRARVGILVVSVFVVLGAAIELSAHRVIGVNHPTLNVAAVRSPAASQTDMPVPIFDTGLSVVCFKVTNSSESSHITGVGLELPGDLSGFALVSPLDRGWSIEEGGDARGFPDATMDFAVVMGTHFAGGRPKQGITTADGVVPICVSGPFPSIPIETMLNGVFVGFRGDDPASLGFDIGVWERR